jgi:hypothetical protein
MLNAYKVKTLTYATRVHRYKPTWYPGTYYNMPANTILRRDAHGDLEMVVEIKPKDSVPPSSKEPYVPIFYRERSFGAY